MSVYSTNPQAETEYPGDGAESETAASASAAHGMQQMTNMRPPLGVRTMADPPHTVAVTGFVGPIMLTGTRRMPPTAAAAAAAAVAAAAMMPAGFVQAVDPRLSRSVTVADAMDDVSSVAPAPVRRSTSDGAPGQVSPVQSPSARSTPAPRHPHSLASLPGALVEPEQLASAAMAGTIEEQKMPAGLSAIVSGQKRARRDSASTFISHAESVTEQPQVFVAPLVGLPAIPLDLPAPIMPASVHHLPAPLSATVGEDLAAAATSPAPSALSPASVSSSTHMFPGGRKPKFHLQIVNSDAPAAASSGDESSPAEQPPERKSKRQRKVTEKVLALKMVSVAPADAAAAADSTSVVTTTAAVVSRAQKAEERRQQKAKYRGLFAQPKSARQRKQAESSDEESVAASPSTRVRRPSAKAAAAAAAATASTPTASKLFPPLSRSIKPCDFEDSFAELARSDGMDDVLQSIAAGDAAGEVIRTRAPSSQPLHAVRVAIFRELAEEYLGRYMKDTPDPEEPPHAAAAAAAAASSSHAAATAASHSVPAPSSKHYRRAKHVPLHGVDARTPEQLRMLFCDAFNVSEGERIPSTFNLNERAGIDCVPSIGHEQRLTSFAAVDTASMKRGGAPPTYEQFRKQQMQNAPATPQRINPHFDLFQFKPLVSSDEYEEMAESDGLARMRRMGGNEVHPTLKPSAYAARETEEQNGAEGHVVAVGAEGAVAMEVDGTTAAAAPLPATNGAVKMEANGTDVVPVLAPITDAVVKAEPGLVASPSVDSGASQASNSLPDQEHIEPALQSAGGPVANGAATAAAASNGVSAEPAPPPAAPLPRVSYGVGMLGALDFTPDRVPGEYRDHWANSCQSWHFDNMSRGFQAHSYSSRSKGSDDGRLVTGILARGQANFHRDMEADEEEERAMLRAQNHESFGRGARAAKAAKNASAGEAEEGAPKVIGYEVGSPEYEQLKYRLRQSLEASLKQPLFLPHTYLRDVSPKLHSRAERMARECVAHLESKLQMPADEVPVDDVFGMVVPGFGCRGVQVFLKQGLCVTMLHDEIGWCSALNYMSIRSRGAALWLGLNMHKASVKLSKDDLRRLINATSFNLSDFLSKLRKLGLSPSMQLQTPGTCIYSPNGTGSAHIVLTVGSWVEQVAINYSLSPSGLRAANMFWEYVDPLLHNSALATRCVLPLLWLQEQKGWELGVGEQLRVLRALTDAAQRDKAHHLHPYWRDFNNPADQEIYCDHCFNSTNRRRAILFVAIGVRAAPSGAEKRYCPACFIDKHADYMYFANVVDRRFK